MRCHQVRTTLRLDDDVLASARVLARQRGESLGAVVSQLARKGLHQPLAPSASPSPHRNDLLLLPITPEGSPVDLELVNGLRDPRHVDHERAHTLLSESAPLPLASCPLTENAVLRILRNPRYPNSPGPPAVLAVDAIPSLERISRELVPSRG